MALDYFGVVGRNDKVRDSQRNTQVEDTFEYVIGYIASTADIVFLKWEGSTYDRNKTLPLRVPDEFLH
jgi:hypothetical protein